MVVRVRMKGLNIVKGRGKFYVYIRDTGDCLVKGFEGSRDDLLKHLASPEILQKHNSHALRKLKSKYADGTLGALVAWYQDECPEYQKLSESTKSDYTAAYTYLRPEFPCLLDDIDQQALYEARDKCAMDRNTRFADQMIAALSSMFTRAIKRGKMKYNPALGMDKIHKTNKSANREWSAAEFQAAIAAAPEHIKTPLMIARYAGFRGQTICALKWSEYQDDPIHGKCFVTQTAKSGGETVYVPADLELQTYLSAVAKRALKICTKTSGQPWASELQMQTEVSHFLRKLESDGVIGANTTLHGLRVTFAADLRRTGADVGQVAAALGDKSDAMGAHYTRHVDQQTKAILAFKGKRKPGSSTE